MVSEVEEIAERIEQRRAQRIPITGTARKRFLRDCQRIGRSTTRASKALSVEETFRENISKNEFISENDLISYRERIAREANEQNQYVRACLNFIGSYTDLDCLLKVIDRAQQVARDSIDDGGQFFYVDFTHSCTKTASRWPWMRSSLYKSLLIIILFYLATPILFCHILNSTNVCQPGPVGGYLSSAYFASVTISTVGYGDMTLGQDPNWLHYVGGLYMIAALVVAAVAINAAAESTASPLHTIVHSLVERFKRRVDDKSLDRDKDLKVCVRRAMIENLTEVCVEVFFFIFIGIVASQIASAFETDPEAKWTIATSFYWATQTCLTIGYGDLSKEPNGLYPFKIIYLLLGTYVVGSSLGRLGSLKEEVSSIKRWHAWDTRPVTRRFIDELQAYDHDDIVDQYEFLVASMVMLGKINSDDIRPVMHKFKLLAGEKDHICITDDIAGDPTAEEEDFSGDTDNIQTEDATTPTGSE